MVSIVKAFAGAGITNRVVALFDNDTAATEALRALQHVQLPKNIAVFKYPDLDALRSYPTEGPTGVSNLNVNGLAASIELYLGAEVLSLSGKLEPVRWRGFSDVLRQYQGEVGNKGQLIARYFEKVTEAGKEPTEIRREEWAGLDAILQTVFRAFKDD